MSRRFGRELALRTLYQVEMSGGKPEQILDYLIKEVEEKPVSDEVRHFSLELVEGTIFRRAKVDRVISLYARDWRIERLAVVDRNVLRLAIFQILFRPDIPINAVINEAVELAKAYGDAESGRFVNGILGQFSRDQQGKGETETYGQGNKGVPVAVEREGGSERGTGN